MSENDDSEGDNATDEDVVSSPPDFNDKSRSTDFTAAQVVLGEWEWRHQHCWKSLQRFGLAAITVAVIPYAKADPFQSKLGLGTLVFPLAAWLLSLTAAWLFTAEYTRCRPAESKYYELLGEKYRPVKLGSTHSKSFWRSIGRSTIIMFIMGSTILSLTNAEVLIQVTELDLRMGIAIRVIFAIIFLIVSLGIAWLMSSWAAKEIGEISNIGKI